MALVAFGMLAVLMSGMVAALETQATMSGVVPADVLDVRPIDKRITPFGDDVKETNTRRIVMARLALTDDVRVALRERLQLVSQERIQAYRESLGNLRTAIAGYRMNSNRDDFKGWNLARILDASGLTQEQKDLLAQVYREAKSSDDSSRHKFILTSPEDRFVAMGKFASADTQEGLAGTLHGFSNESQKRFFGIFGGGTIVGVHDNKVFWGSYWIETQANGRQAQMFELHNFGSEDRVIQGNYFVY